MKTKRILLLLLALALLCSVLCACRTDGTEGDETDGGTEGETSEYPTFHGETLRILSWNDSNVREFILPDEAEQYSGQVVEWAVYQRNETAQKLLNITAEYNGMEGSPDKSSAVQNFMSQVRASHLSGGIYDAYCTHSLCAALLTTEGIYASLSKQSALDFTRDCWPQNLLNEATVFGDLYFCSGDISTNLMFMSSVVYYNKTLYAKHELDGKLQKDYGYSSIYEMVKDGAWSLDVLTELSKDVYTDTDSDNVLSSGDTYGFGTYSLMLRNFYWGAGLRALDNTENGLALTADFKNVAKVSSILKDVGDFLNNSGDAYLLDGVASSRSAFSEGRLLFNLAPASHAYKVFRNVETLTYGVLPVPKYDTSVQADYSSIASNPYSMWGIEGNSGSIEIAAAYLQALADQSLLLTRPAIFEKTMKLFYADRTDDSEMWDIIADTQRFDCGVIFGREIGAYDGEFPLCNLFVGALEKGSSAWSTVLAGDLDRLNGYLDALNEKLLALK